MSNPSYWTEIRIDQVREVVKTIKYFRQGSIILKQKYNIIINAHNLKNMASKYKMERDMGYGGKRLTGKYCG
jgi:hypothetical protein